MTNNPETIKKFKAANSDISNEIEKNGIEAGLLSYLEKVAKEFPDGKFPSGLTAEQVAEGMLKSLKSYVNTRDAQLEDDKVYTENEVRTLIVESIKAIPDDKDKLHLVATIVLYFKYLDLDSAKVISAEELQSECTQLIDSYEGLDNNEVIDSLLNSIDYSKTGTILSKVSAQVDVNVFSAGIIDNITADFNTLKEHVIGSATYYTLAAKGELDGIPVDQDPGVVAAEYAAFTDSQRVAVLSEGEKITEDEFNKLQDIICVSLTVALTVAVAVLYALSAYVLLKLLAVIALSVGLSVGIVKAMVFCVGIFFMCYYLDNVAVESLLKSAEISEKAVLWGQDVAEKFKAEDDIDYEDEEDDEDLVGTACAN